jgi:hypothetical protein
LLGVPHLHENSQKFATRFSLLGFCRAQNNFSIIIVKKKISLFAQVRLKICSAVVMMASGGIAGHGFDYFANSQRIFFSTNFPYFLKFPIQNLNFSETFGPGKYYNLGKFGVRHHLMIPG